MALSYERKKEVLEIVTDLRVTDMRDGLDWLGYHHVGTVTPDIRPLWRTKAAGFARTRRYIPTQQTVPTMDPEDYTKWAFDYWYKEVMDPKVQPEPFDDTTFLVIDMSGCAAPAVGSMDSMMLASKGVRGVLTDGGTRDSDENLETKHLPVWSRWIVQTMFQGRVEYESHDQTVAIGGQTVRPGDLVVADGDGALIVPQGLIDGVLKYAMQESENDRRARKVIFDHLGLPLNDSVQSKFDVPAHPYAWTPEKHEEFVRKG